ncbi:MAG: hypothetical protein V3U17_04870 [Thermoplasmata archaeon]
MRPRLRTPYWTVLLLVFLIVPTSAPPVSAQGESRGDWVWSRFWSDGFGEAAAVDDSGIYVVGLDAGLWSDRPRTTESVLLKFGLDGEERWVRSLPSITTDYHGLAINDSDVYIVGQSGDIFVDARDVILQKYTADGLKLWTRRFGSELADIPRDAVADSSGVYVVGDSWAPTDRDSSESDSFVSKYDRDGNELWTTRFAPTRNVLSGVDVGSSGIYIVGSQEDRATLWKFELTGNLEWTLRIEQPVLDIGDVAVDAHGVYIVGTTTGPLTAQGSIGETDAFVRKYDTGGNESWTRQFGAPGFPGTPADDKATGVAVRAWGVYVAGTISRGTPGPHDAFGRRFATDGTELWAFRYVGASDARGLAVGRSGIYLTGTSEGRAYLARFAETPDAPRNVQASPGEGQVGLEWNLPPFDGGMPILSFQVYRGTQRGALEPLAKVGATALTYIDSSVANQITYHYAVAALNMIGEGPWAPSNGVTPGSPPAVVNPVPPPLDPFVLGVITILGGALLLAAYWLRRVGKPGDDRIPSRNAPRRVSGLGENAESG